jgi:hypothetical protein
VVRRLAACALLLGLVTACRPDTVAVSFRPKVGTTYRYEIRVKATSTTTLDGNPPDRRVEEVRLVAVHTVLAAGADGVRVRVLVGEPGAAAQAFIVRFDRAAQLESIESVEGASAEIVGALGVPEIFPGATGVPAGRRLAPGDRWTVDRTVAVPGAEQRSRLQVRGRLVELGLAGHEKVARVTSTAELPLRASATTTGGLLILDGDQRIEQRASYDLDDGAVRGARTTTTGRFHVEVQPPAGTVAPAVPGTLDVRVTSTTRRL